MFGWLRGKETKAGPQEVQLNWEGVRDQRKAMLYASRFQVAARLTQIALAHDKDPEEVVALFTKTDDLLEDWYKGAPLKAELKRMLDALYPDPLGFEPGDSMIPEDQKWPGESIWEK